MNQSPKTYGMDHQVAAKGSTANTKKDHAGKGVMTPQTPTPKGVPPGAAY